jgi:predicted NBD/HSP70 family sugar kinase
MRTIGVLAAEHIAVGLVEDNRIIGPIRNLPENIHDTNFLLEMPCVDLVDAIRNEIEAVRAGDSNITAVGVGFPGIIRDGVVDESPNLKQIKGQDLGTALGFLLSENGLETSVHVLNDADAFAAGIAATKGHLDKLIRVWTLGIGVGFGRYPQSPGIWEGGHTIVTLDTKEKFCQCGGRGHLEGIMGHRAMRMRFLDLEPDEVFAQAKEGDRRCIDFVKLWHQALAAASSTTIHMAGPGKFFISGPNAKYVDADLLDLYVREMVHMSPLQGSTFEVVPIEHDIGIIGAAVSAAQAVS